MQTGGPLMLDEVKRIGTIKDLRKFLCTLAVPRGHKGMPKANVCRACQSQCGYGRRLIELVQENGAKGAEAKKHKRSGEEEREKEKKTEMQEQSTKPPATEDESILTVRMTRSQAFNVAEFIEMHLIDTIRNDPDLDNVEWIGDMVDAMRALKEASK